MTRREFVDNPPDNLSDLISLARDWELYDLTDVYVDSGEIDNMICEEIRESMSRLYWYQIADKLADIPRGCDWYIRDGDLDYSDGDDSYDSLYEDVLYAMDRGEMWDEDYDEDDEEEDEEDEEDEEEEDLPPDPVDTSLASAVFSIDEMLSSQSDQFQVLRASAEEAVRQRAETARSFVENLIRENELEKEREAERVKADVECLSKMLGF